jgi:hypothetical protein
MARIFCSLETWCSTSVQSMQEKQLWGMDYEKPMRTWHKHSCAQWSTGWVWHSPSRRREQEAKCSTAAFPKLFTFREREQVSLVTMSLSSPRTVAPPPCLPLGIRLAEEGCEGFLMGDILIGGRLERGLLLNDSAGCCCWVILEIRGNMG